MSLYINTNTGQIRQFDNAWFDACVAAGNPKVDGWVLMDPQPEPPPPPPPAPYRVSKDTIVSRVYSAGKLSDLIAAINSLSTEQSFMWTHFAWFWSDNQTIIGMCQSLSLDPAVILAPDPYIFN
jgi:hypothetical protein